MQSFVVVLGWSVGLVLALGAAPDAGAELQQCLRSCGDEASSSTDEETCRLRCRQQTEAREAPIKSWKRTELKGGSPDPNVKGGSVTTTVERGPDGTVTTVERSDGRGNKQIRRVAGTKAERDARREGTVPFSRSRRLRAWCYLACSARGTLAQRTSCRTTCPRLDPVELPTSKTAPTAARKPSTTTTTTTTTTTRKKDPAACRAACARRARRCRDACTGSKADRNTCELQCDQSASACRNRCD